MILVLFNLIISGYLQMLCRAVVSSILIKDSDTQVKDTLIMIMIYSAELPKIALGYRYLGMPLKDACSTC